MYLAKLSKEEKELFLGIAYNLVYIDGVYSTEEQEMMDEYCHEMQIEFKQETMTKPIEELIDVIKNKCDIKVKKIVVFEAVGLAMVDGNYDDDERTFILNMQKEFGIDKEFEKQCETILQEYIKFQERINELVIE